MRELAVVVVFLLSGCTQHYIDSRDQTSFTIPGTLLNLNKNPVRVESLRKIKDANSKIIADASGNSGGDLGSMASMFTNPAAAIGYVVIGKVAGFMAGSISDKIIAKYANDDLYEASLVNSYNDWPVGFGRGSKVYVAVLGGFDIARDRIYISQETGNKILGQPIYRLIDLNSAKKDDVKSLPFLEKMKKIDSEIASNPRFFLQQRFKYR